MAWLEGFRTKQPEPTRFEAGGCRQAGAARRNCAFRSLKVFDVRLSLVPSLKRESHSAKSLRALCILIWELTFLAEQLHQINGTVSEDHLHSMWCRVIPRYCSHTSNIVDWLRLWRAHRARHPDSKRRKQITIAAHGLSHARLTYLCID